MTCSGFGLQCIAQQFDVINSFFLAEFKVVRSWECRCNKIPPDCCWVMSALRCLVSALCQKPCYWAFFIHKHMADDGGSIICLVWSVCTWTDLWRMAALNTDQVMEEKLEFIPEWFMRSVSHMMVSAQSVEPPATCLALWNDGLAGKLTGLRDGSILSQAAELCYKAFQWRVLLFGPNWVTLWAHASSFFFFFICQKHSIGTEESVKSCKNTEKNWSQCTGGSGLSIIRLRCQDTSLGCKCWHVMQPCTISALSWCKKKNLHWESKLPYEWVSTGMYGT